MSTAKILLSRVEYAASDGAACQARTFCRGTFIPLGALRWAMKEEGKEHDVYYHWGCGNGNMINALGKTKNNGSLRLQAEDQLRVMQSIETGMIAPNEISKSSIPPKLVLPPPAKAKHLNHLLATLETVGVGANHYPQKRNGGEMECVREPEDDHDSNSIAIYNKHGKIGHLPAYCSVRLASLVDNMVIALKIQPERPDSNCSGAAEFNVRVGIFCVEEHREKIATALTKLRFKPVQRAILTIHPVVAAPKSEAKSE